MTPDEMWSKALSAAVALRGLERAVVHVGAGLPVELVRELARLAGAAVTHTGYYDATYGGGPSVIEAFSTTVDGVEIKGQGSRPFTADDMAADA